METVGQFDAPFRLYEVVEIHPIDLDTDPEVVSLSNQRGVVTDVGYNHETEQWDVFVAVQNGEHWYFEASELRSIGVVLTPDRLYASNQASPTIRVHVDPESGAGTVVAGDSTLLPNKPVPLATNLDELK